MRINADTIYLCDNGAAYCGEHLGSSAKATGRDISGQMIERISADQCRAEGCEPFKCEKPSCERHAQ